MEVQLNEVEYCKVQASYKADADVVSAKRTEAVKQLRKVAMPGFRANKAPDYAIKHHFKNQIDDWVKREMIQQAFDDILFETKIKPIGRPECLQAELGELTFSCEISVMKKPEFTLKEYKGMEIPKPPSTHTSSELVEKMLQELRIKHAEIAPYEEKDVVQSGDQITMDFAITIDGADVPGGKGEGQLYTVFAPETVFPEFDTHLLGTSAGQTIEFDAVLPSVFGEHKDKKGHVVATVHMGVRKTPVPLDDELAKKENLASLSELRARLEGVAAENVQQIEMARISEQIQSRLIVDNDFQLSDQLNLMEAQLYTAQQGIKWETLADEQKEAALKRAAKSVRLSLILDSIQEQEPEAVLSDNEIANIIRNRLQQMGVENVEQQIQHMSHNGQLLGLGASLKNEFTVQWLIKQSKILDV